MGSHLFYSQLALLARIWLFVMVHLRWPRRSAPPPTAPAPPIKPKRKRSKEPKVFEGLPPKPPCALGERETAHPQPPPPVPPEPMPPPNRRPRTVDTSRHCCPQPGCRDRGWLGRGNLRANGHPNGRPWRQFHGTSCAGFVPEHHGTILHGKQVAVAFRVPVLACVAAGVGIRAPARGCEVAPNTVLQWLREAAEQLTAFAAYFLGDLHGPQLQRAELHAVRSALKDGELTEAQAIQRLSRSPHWVWVAIAPVTKLLRTIDVGKRTLALAQGMVHPVAAL